MAQKTINGPDQGEALWEVEESKPDELQAYVAGRLGTVPAAVAPTEPAWVTEPDWVKSAFDASWPLTLVHAEALR